MPDYVTSMAIEHIEQHFYDRPTPEAGFDQAKATALAKLDTLQSAISKVGYAEFMAAKVGGDRIASLGRSAEGELYFRDLLDSQGSIEQLIANHGQKTFLDLMRLHEAIVKGETLNIGDNIPALHAILTAMPEGHYWLDQYCDAPSGDWRTVPEGSICMTCKHAKGMHYPRSLCWLGWPGVTEERGAVLKCKAYADGSREGQPGEDI